MFAITKEHVLTFSPIYWMIIKSGMTFSPICSSTQSNNCKAFKTRGQQNMSKLKNYSVRPASLDMSKRFNLLALIWIDINATSAVKCLHYYINDTLVSSASISDKLIGMVIGMKIKFIWSEHQWQTNRYRNWHENQIYMITVSSLIYQSI